MQALKNLKNRSNIRVLDDVIQIAPKLLSQIMQTARVRIAEDSPVRAKMIVKGGVGVSGGICLGWANTEGFRMVGVQGAVSVAAGIGADMLVGRHMDLPLVKSVLGLPNICIELIFEASPIPDGDKEEDPVEEVGTKAEVDSANTLTM